MNTEKVFRAFNKEGKEILLYRKDIDTYIDLNSKNSDIYPKEEIDIETLLPLSKTIHLFKHMTEYSIKRKYNKDREKLVETKKVLVGLKQKISELETEEIDNGWRYYGIPLTDTRYNWKCVLEKIGLYLYSQPISIKREGEKYNFNLYKDLCEFQDYLTFHNNVKNISKNPNFNNGMKYVVLTEYTLEDLIKEPYIEKKLVYEYANAARKEKLEKKER